MEISFSSLEKYLNSPFMVGAFGAAVASYKFIPTIPGNSKVEKFINVFCGAMVSNYLAPSLVTIFNINTPTYLGGVSFLLGMLGMAVLAALFQGIRDTNVTQLLTSWLRRPGSPKD